MLNILAGDGFEPKPSLEPFRLVKIDDFYYYDIIIRPIDPEIEIDFDPHGFLPILGQIYCVHFTLL